MLKTFVQSLRKKKKQVVPKPKRVRAYVRTDAPSPREQPKNEFAAFVRSVKNIKDIYLRQLANRMATEERQIGREGVMAVLYSEGLAHQDFLRADALLALPPEADDALKGLTCDHALTVVKAKHLSDAKRVNWLKRAQKHGLSPLELQRSIEADRVVTLSKIREASGQNSGFHTIENVMHQFEQWEARMNRDNPVKHWDVKTRTSLLVEMAPVSQFLRMLGSK